MFPGSQHAQMDTPALSETTLLSVEEMGFALEPVPITRTPTFPTS